MRTIPCGFLVVLCFVAAVRSEAQSNRLTVDQAMSGRLLQGFSASPDGTRLLFSLKDPAKKAATQELTHTWIYSAGSGEVHQFTDSVKSETRPRWSPNGRQVAFLSDREEFRQIYVMSADGGEAKRLTEGKRSIEDFVWSPNGEQIAFIAPDPKTDEEERKERDKDDAWSVPTDSWDFYLKKRNHLWLIDVASGQTRQVVGAPWHFLELDWSASANRLIAAATDKPDSDHPAERIYSVSLADGKMQQLAAPTGRFSGITISPDGKYIGYVGARVDGPLPYDLYITAIDGGSAPRNLTAKSIDRPVTIPLLGGRSRPYEWLSGQELAVLVDDGFRSKLYSVSIDGRATVLASPEVRVTGFHLSGRSSGILIAETMTQWPELWEWTGGSTLKRISHLNTSLDGVALSQPQFIHYKSFDGRQIEAAVLTPTAVSGGSKPPAMIFVHGGPGGAFYDSLGAEGAAGELLASAGYAVIYPNVCGSVSYGFESTSCVRRDWGGRDYKDVLAAADYLVSNGIADPKRLGVGGWSYGGYMAMWASTQTDRFKAAIAGAGLSDLATEFGTENLQTMDSYDYWYNGTPYENYEVYRKNSPITFIRNVVKYGRTPTLILQGEVDPIDPIGQSQIWYRGLRRYGVETEMVIYPREPHGLVETAHLKDRLNRFVAWFDKYLKP